MSQNRIKIRAESVNSSFVWEGKPDIDNISVTRILRRRFDENLSLKETQFLSTLRIRRKTISRFKCVYWDVGTNVSPQISVRNFAVI
jgi:hypothetical protein